MYTEVDGKLIDTQIITIAPIGGAMKEQIISKINSMTNANEEKLLEIFEKVDMLKTMVKNEEVVTEEEVLSIAEEIDIEFGFEPNVLSDKIGAIFKVSDGSKHNIMVVLGAVYNVLGIIKIQLLKNSVLKNKRMDGVNDDTFL
ncbi:MAG: hypothetical protein N4A64_08930 [Marinisporobacter sp.]|jgi:hypothetical protein|nr:hypothetical protein [Marinisporobacter sp.]